MRFWRIASMHNFLIVFIIDRKTLWHHVIAFEENSEQNIHFWPYLTYSFRSWLFWMLPFDWLGFGFNIIASYDLFEQVWIVFEHRQHLLSDVHATLFCSKYSNFGTVFAAARFMSNTSVKNSWHRANDMPTSLATSLIVTIDNENYILYHFFTIMLSSVVDVLRRLGRAFSRPSLNQLYLSTF